MWSQLDSFYSFPTTQAQINFKESQLFTIILIYHLIQLHQTNYKNHEIFINNLDS